MKKQVTVMVTVRNAKKNTMKVKNGYVALCATIGFNKNVFTNDQSTS